MKAKKRTIWIVGVVVVLALAGLLVLRQRAAKPKQAAAPELAAVSRGDVKRTVSADGTLRAKTTVEVKSDAGGKVILLAVEVGDRVKKGDLIAKIDPTDTQSEYDQAVATMQSSRAALSQAVDQARAQPLLTRAAIAEAQAGYDSALADLKRLQTATQPRDRTDARTTLDKALAARRSAQETLGRLKVATHPVARSSSRSTLDQAQASLSQAEETLTRLKAAGQPQALAQAKAALDKAKSDLAVAQSEYKRAQTLNKQGYVSQSDLETAENKVENTRASYASAQETVRTLADDQAAELRSAQAAVSQAKAALAAAQDKWGSLDADQGAERRAAEANLQEAEAEVAAAQRKWNTIDQDQAAELRAAREKVSQARAALLTARTNSVQNRVKAADVVTQQANVTKAAAQVSSTRTTLSYTTITAPRDGVILAKDVEEGTIVNSGRSGVATGTTIVELGDLSSMYVDVDVDETDLADVKDGQHVNIDVDSVGDKVLHGLVTRVDPEATTTSNVTTVKVEIQVLDSDKRLLPGLSATCDFLVGERKNVLVLPSRTIKKRDGKAMVSIPGATGAQMMEVQIGLEGDEETEIVSGLNEGDKVIVPQLGAPAAGGFRGGPPGMGSGFVKGK